MLVVHVLVLKLFQSDPRVRRAGPDAHKSVVASLVIHEKWLLEVQPSAMMHAGPCKILNPSSRAALSPKSNCVLMDIATQKAPPIAPPWLLGGLFRLLTNVLHPDRRFLAPLLRILHGNLRAFLNPLAGFLGALP